ncbi:hypothetical protein LUI43_003498, partial [Escherichia coli]|nr:hypothetical protein [Escherichia coli]
MAGFNIKHWFADGAFRTITRSEKLRREVELAEALLKQREQDSDRYSGREDDPQVPRQLRQSRHRRP